MRHVVPSLALVLTASVMGSVAACAGRTLEPYDNGNSDSGTDAPTGTATSTSSTTPTGTVTSPPPPPNPNPKGEIKGTISGDPGCPKTLAEFQSMCMTAGAVCDVNLSDSCTGTKLRYMCIRYDQKSPGYWTEALHPSLECSCPTTRPSFGATCAPSLPRDCSYANPQCPNDVYARDNFQCVEWGNGKGAWQGYGGWCNGQYPYPDGGWDEPPPWGNDGGKPIPPPATDGGKPMPDLPQSSDAGKPMP